MTRGITGRKGEGKVFGSPEEVRSAYDGGVLDLHSKIHVRMQGKRYETTVGRILLWEVIPKVDILELRHLMLANEDEVREAQRQLEAGRGFTDVVRELSKSADRDNEGHIGKLTYNEFKSFFNCEESDVDMIYALIAAT
jgi:DNA-directed RNA polymerase subunit beta'